MGKKILVTGGTGAIGSVLCKLLVDEGHSVALLSRAPKKHTAYPTFKWDIEKQEIDPDCINGVDTILHLAGAGIADKRWTDERKKVLIDSRTQSIGLIYSLLRNKEHQVKTVVSASAAGYYSDRGDELLTESDAPANDFLAQCCIAWEKAVDKGKELGLRIVKMRTGVVLEKNAGALKPIAAPIKLGFGTALGSGKQWISWIHVKDVAQMYLFAIENKELSGVYNMCSPQPTTNEGLTKAIASQLHKPLWLPNVPALALKLAMGEMSAVVLGSTKMSAKKIESTGFRFAYPELSSALKEIYG
ncbi:TIGR01777 family oxidoreductase [Pelobium manganitolerans]|uniref:TIGR01777 family oxidoreductase n=1 Tax=Pelobium manganitolerans TaxID=1842495 RepID=UPI003FA3DD51